MSSLVYSVNLAAQLLISVFVFGQVMEKKKNIWLIFSVLFIPYDIIHIIFNYFGESVPETVQSLSYFLLTFGVMYFLFEGKLLKKIIVFFSYLGFQIITELISLLMVCQLFNIKKDDFYEYGDKNIYVSAARVMYVDIMLISAILIFVIFSIRKKEQRKVYRDYAVMTGFSAVHLIFLCLYYRYNIESMYEMNNIIQIVFQTLFITMIFIQYDNSQKMRLMTETEKELEILKNKMESTYDYYMLAEEKFEDISKIRHDIRNQVQTVRVLLSSPEGINDAGNILDSISDNLESVKMTNYCENSIVNAVLSLKISNRKYSGIRTDIILKDIGYFPFTEYEMCSIVSNLFDNAAEECIKQGENTFIEMRSERAKGYCILKITNTASENTFDSKSRKQEQGHGYGLKIINSICRKYDGEFTLKCENECAVATVIVPSDN